MSGGRQTECTFNHEEGGAIITGKVYIDDKRMRGDFTTSDPEFGNLDGSIIKDDKFLLTWGGPLGDIGTKSILSEVDDYLAENLIITNDRIGFDCSDWVVNDKVFMQPESVVFTEITSEDRQAAELELSPSRVDCSVCNLIDETVDREKCRETLKCKR